MIRLLFDLLAFGCWFVLAFSAGFAFTAVMLG